MSRHAKPEQKAEALKLVANGMRVRNVAKKFGFAKSTVHRWRAEADDREPQPPREPADPCLQATVDVFKRRYDGVNAIGWAEPKHEPFMTSLKLLVQALKPGDARRLVLGSLVEAYLRTDGQ